MKDRILLDQSCEIGDEVILEGPPLEALRVQGPRLGSILTLTDSQKREFRGKVLRLSDREATVHLFETFPTSTESPLEIFLLQALPAKERMEWIIQKATELGVSAILPFKSEKSISLEERDSKQKKSHRWQAIAVKAVHQSRRAKVPKIERYRSFAEALAYCQEDGLKILLYEKGGENLKEVLKRFSPLFSPFGKIYLMVGPEGGFTKGEVEEAKRNGFIAVKLGQRLLRTETAAISLVGILQYELGDLG